MYLSSTDLFAPCPGPISFKRASSTHVVLWNLRAQLQAFTAVCTPMTLSQSTQQSPMPHYWAASMSLKPDTNNQRWDHNITVQGDIRSITQSGQRGWNWNGRKDLDPLINQRPGWAGLLLSKHLWGAGQIGLWPPCLCLILGLYPLLHMKVPSSQHVSEISSVLCTNTTCNRATCHTI